MLECAGNTAAGMDVQPRGRIVGLVSRTGFWANLGFGDWWNWFWILDWAFGGLGGLV
jgi:hypothetical protein